MNDKTLYEETVQTPVKSTIFSDGMVVNANDLHDAMLYPLELIQVLIRAYFGCGIVCGLELETDGKCEVTISPGVALDCDGYPLNLLHEVKIPLIPDPCVEEDSPTCVCIAISRCESPSAPIQCGGDGNDASHAQYSRQTEAVKIKAFPVTVSEGNYCDMECDKLPDNLCVSEPEGEVAEGENQVAFSYCDCLKHCSELCCGESWVFIGCVTIDGNEISIPERNSGFRKYVKPIACACEHERQTEEGNRQ